MTFLFPHPLQIPFNAPFCTSAQIGLFMLQSLGTHRVSFLFSPMVALWMVSIMGIGIYNLHLYGTKVFQVSPKCSSVEGMEGVETGSGCSVAPWRKPIRTHNFSTLVHTLQPPVPGQSCFPEIKKSDCDPTLSTLLHTPQGLSPHYIVEYFIENKGRAWESLGGVMLTLTGAEALFADLGHFNISSVGVGFSFFVYPCIIIAYLGQVSWCVGAGTGANNRGTGCGTGCGIGEHSPYSHGALQHCIRWRRLPVLRPSLHHCCLPRPGEGWSAGVCTDCSPGSAMRRKPSASMACARRAQAMLKSNESMRASVCGGTGTHTDRQTDRHLLSPSQLCCQLCSPLTRPALPHFICMPFRFRVHT